MAFRVHSGPARSAKLPPPLERDHSLYKEFNTLDEALGWARHVNKSGHITLLIEGDDGTCLTKQEVFAALKHPESDSDDTPERERPCGWRH